MRPRRVVVREGGTTMMVLIAATLGLIVLDVAALCCGADSRDGPDNPEWERRRNRRSFL